MSVNVMPIGGKFDNDGNPVVMGVAVDGDGAPISARKWKNEVVQILDVTDPTSGTKVCTVIDLANAGAVSLRVDNGLNVPVQLVFYTDYYNHNYYMRDATGSYITKTIPAGQKFVMITPDDIPAMQWLAKLKIGAKIAGDSITGDLDIWAVVKG